MVTARVWARGAARRRQGSPRSRQERTSAGAALLTLQSPYRTEPPVRCRRPSGTAPRMLLPLAASSVDERRVVEVDSVAAVSDAIVVARVLGTEPTVAQALRAFTATG